MIKMSQQRYQILLMPRGFTSLRIFYLFFCKASHNIILRNNLFRKNIAHHFKMNLTRIQRRGEIPLFAGKNIPPE